MNKYLADFLNLKCAGDVLNVVSPVTRFEKEISEAMAIVKQVKKIVFAKPDIKYTIVDMCAGNGIASVIIAHLLPVKEVIAIDKKTRDRYWERVRNFKYIEDDISNIENYLPNLSISVNLYTNNQTKIKNDTIIISCHPCKTAHSIIELYLKHDYYKHLILMPCCHGKLRNKIPSWTYDLSISAKGNFIIDKNVISPCNAIVVAGKE